MGQNDVIIYTDGSCDKNPGGNGGWAAIIISKDSTIKVSGYEPNTTNQRMEMKAVINGIQMVNKSMAILLYTDSAYICNGVNNRWWDNWIKNGWKNSSGEDVKNRDLWEKLMQLVTSRNIDVEKVKGHAFNFLNNSCDAMAKEIISFRKSIIREIGI